MNCDPIVIAGLAIACNATMFLAVLAVHIPFGVASVVTGLIAIFSHKGLGRHPRFGTLYYGCLLVVFITASILALMRWAENYHLAVLGALSFAAASLGRTAHRRRWRGWVRLHISGLGLSYVLMLTAFYVDNGQSLPLWKELPPLTYWVLPSAIGLPIILWALWRHPLVQSRKSQPGPSLD
jgi:primosomal protein N'